MGKKNKKFYQTQQQAYEDLSLQKHGVNSVDVVKEENMTKTQDITKQQEYENFQKWIKEPMQIDLKQLHESKPLLMIATPAYGGLYTDVYHRSLMQGLGALGRLQIPTYISTITNESLVTRARNILVAMFLANKDATHLMFIDADIGFNAENIAKMMTDTMRDDVEIVCGAYPKKGINWQTVIDAVNRGEDNAETIEHHSSNYVINFKEDNVKIQNGLCKILDPGTGFMLIKKNVFVKLIAEFGDKLKYDNDLPYLAEDVAKNCYAFFDTCIEGEGVLDFVKGSRRYLSEDYFFARLCQRLGIDTWLDPRVELHHAGSHVYKGDVSNLFRMK